MGLRVSPRSESLALGVGVSPARIEKPMPTERSFGPRPSVPCLCLPHLLEHQARRIPDAPAILALGRPPLTYGRLYQHVDETERTLRAMGIGRHDRIAVVLPNGPELAVAILSVAASAACAPVNPAFGNEELEEYFASLRPQAVVTQAGSRLAGAPYGTLPRDACHRAVDRIRCRGWPLHADRTPRECALRRAGQRRSHSGAAPHLWYDGPAQDRPADASQHLYVGLRHRSRTGAERNGSMPQHHAPVSWARYDGHRGGLARGRRERRVYPRT